MSAPNALPRPELRTARRTIPRIILWLAAGLLVLGVVFHQEINAAIAVWASSTAYSYCFIVLPIALYLAWDRRAVLHGATAKPIPLVALAGIPVALIWLAAERLGIMEGRQLAAMTFVELLFVAVLGWRLSWAMAGPLLYLYFLVPVGAFITPHLQNFTTDFVQVGLNLLHIPVYIDGHAIEIPQGTFFIADACAGLRFLIASIAFGTLYSLVIYRTPLRRALFMLVSLIVPVIANGFRALGIVVLGNLLGSAKAAATDHVLYGWLFFSIVILILIALGMPFREDEQDSYSPPQSGPGARLSEPDSGRRGVFAAAAVCLMAMLSPAAALALEPGTTPIPGPLSAVDFGPACTPLNNPGSARQAGAGAAGRLVRCNGLRVMVRMSILSPHVTAGPLFHLERNMIAAMQSEDGYQSSWIHAASGQRKSWRLLESPDLSRVMAVAMWVNGKPTQPGLADRVRMAWTSIVGAHRAPLVMTATPEVDWGELGEQEKRDMVNRFVQVLQSWPNMSAELRRITGHA